MISSEEELVSLEEVASVLHAYAGPDDLRERPARRRGSQWRPVLLAAAAVAALAGASAAVAAGLGAFNGISVAQNTQTGTIVLPAAVLAQVKQQNATAAKWSWAAQLLPDTARVLGKMPDGSLVYGLSDTHGNLCTIGEAAGSCGPPLSRSHPITDGFGNTGSDLIASGIAMDGVTSVSFTVNGTPVTVPVKNNVWVYEQPGSNADGADCIMAQFADGSTVNAFPEVPCP